MERFLFIESMFRIYVYVYALSHISPLTLYAQNFGTLPTTRFRRYWRVSIGFIRVLFHLSVALWVYAGLVRAVIVAGQLVHHSGLA